MSTIPVHEHEVKDSITDDSFVEDRTVGDVENAARTESSVFRHTKKIGHAAGLRCAISGQKEGVQYHHLWLEWSAAAAVDWHLVKKIAMDGVKELPVLELGTDSPTGETFPVEQSYIYKVIKYTKADGFDWAAFDPEKPEQFVDSIQNMLVLIHDFHTGIKGIHHHSGPMWEFFGWPRLDGFVYTPNELSAINEKLKVPH